jgi:hypothetical protein
MIDVKQAIQIARHYILDLYEPQTLQGPLLEEVERSDDEQYWLVTFGFDTDRLTLESSRGISIPIVRPKYVREYKTIKVRAETGDVESMKIRTV